MKTSNFALPLRIEDDYMFLRAKVLHDVGRIGTRRLVQNGHLLSLRNDAKDDPQLLELAALLGLTADQLLDRRKLREKLRRLGRRLSVEKQTQLAALLGKWVREPDPRLVERWVDEQVEAVSLSVNSWLGRAAVALGSLAITGNLVGVAANQTLTPEQARDTVAAATAVQATRARQAASSAVLNLNTALLENASIAAGIGYYTWVTAGDDAVRDNHAELDGTIQSWAIEPIGGGTKPEDPGHPGSGYGCRCIAEPTILAS